MNRTRVFLFASLLIAILILIPNAFAQCDPEDLDCNFTPPQSEEVDPDSVLGGGGTGDVDSEGAPAPIGGGPAGQSGGGSGSGSGSPSGSSSGSSSDDSIFVDPEPIGSAGDPGPVVETIPVDVIHAEPGDDSGAIPAIGMAMGGEGGNPPSLHDIQDYLNDNGSNEDGELDLDELANAADHFGADGSEGFTGGDLNLVLDELNDGRTPVVVLGTEDGEERFVTVTGISDDGEWIAFIDPVTGTEVVLSTGEFTRLWELGGNSGILVKPQPRIPGTDSSLPWVLVALGLMGAASQARTALGAVGTSTRRRENVEGPSVEYVPVPPYPEPSGTVTPSPTPTSTPTPTPTLTPTYTPVPTPTDTPVPEDRYERNLGVPPIVAPKDPDGFDVDDVLDEVEEHSPLITTIYKILIKAKSVWATRVIRLNELVSGKISISVPGLSPGQKLGYRTEKWYIPGTRYNAENIPPTVAKGLFWRSVKGIGVSAATSVITNLFDFTLGENKTFGVWSPEFFSSTMVDFIKASVIGIGSAVLVGGALALAGVSLPFIAVAGITAGVALLAGFFLDKIIDTDQIKARIADGIRAWGGVFRNIGTIISHGARQTWQKISNGIHAWGGIARNARTIISHGVERVRQGISNTTRNVVDTGRRVYESAKNTVKSVGDTISNLASSAKEKVGGFLGSLFGG